MGFTWICKGDDVWEGDKLLAEVGLKQILILRLNGGELRAIQPDCPHQGHPLNEGEFDGCEIVCPFHLWRFNCATGHGVNPADARLKLFPIKELDGDIYLDPEKTVNSEMESSNES
jgi:toluene monooxygenase system ferredoxin subunit